MSDRSNDAANDGLPDLATIIDRRHTLIQRIEAAGGDPAGVEIVAVTKRFPPRAIELAVEAGFANIGENYAQELIEKTTRVGFTDDRSDLVSAPTWHMIGGLQRNKVKKLAAVTAQPSVAGLVLQTIDRTDLVVEVAKRMPAARVFIQVNTTSESQKSGCAVDEVPRLVEETRAAGLDLAGLMTIGPTDGSDPAPAFERLRDLVDHHGLAGASMGMSGDIEAAVAAGSTMIRVGSALFGARPTNL